MNPQDADLLRRCQEALARRDGTAALPLAYLLLAAGPNVPDYHNILGLAQYFAGNPVAAETAYRRALELGGEDGRILSNLGILYMGWKRYPQAVEAFERAAALLGNNAHSVLFNLAQCYVETQQLEEAIAALRTSVELDPSFLKAWHELGLALRKKGERDGDLGDIDAAFACYDRIAAADPKFPFLDEAIANAWRVRARIELDKGDPAAAVRSCVRYYRDGQLTAKDFTVLQNGKIGAGRESDVFRFENARVLPGNIEWFVLDGETIYAAPMGWINPVGSPYVEAYGDRLLVARLPKQETRIDKPAFLLGGSNNYYHWLIDYLPRPAVYARHESFRDLRFLTNGSPASFQRESLRLAGIDGNRLIEVPKALSRPQVLLCDELFATPVPRKEGKRGHLDPEALRWLRETLGATAAGNSRPQSAAGERIYISRRDAATRRVVNDDEVVDFLKSQGFEVVVAGKLPLSRQIAAFANAKVIVGPHGAGLSNMVFAPPGAKVIELMGSAMFQQGFFLELAESCGHGFDRLFCQTRPSKMQHGRVGEHDFDMFVSTGDLARSLAD